MNWKNWREDINYNIGHKGYVIHKDKYVEAEVISKTYYENGARKGSTVKCFVVTHKGKHRNRLKDKDVIKIFTTEETKKNYFK